MRRIIAAAVLSSPVAWAALTTDVRALIAQHQLAAAANEVRAIQSRRGPSGEVAEALSWLARGSLAERRLSEADAYANEARSMAVRILGMRRIDSDPFLPTAVGASIEVHASVLAAHGARSEAVAFLEQERNTWKGTSLAERIQKNINLLGLEGKPAPALEGVDRASLKGHPVRLFFWAHWCPDCKADVPVIAEARKRFAPQGLVVIGPTRLYGYVAGGDPAPAAVETKYIEQVRRQYYVPLQGMPAPLSAANFESYGASTTPTIVLLDRAGVVRFYHPGAVAWPELSAKIEQVLRK